MIRQSFIKSTIALLSMVFFVLVSCSDDHAAPENGTDDSIQNIEVPSSDVSSPIVSGQMVVIRGNGFTENSEIWFQASTRSTGKKADIISYSDEGISFIAPQMSGSCDVILKQGGNTQALGQVYLEERDLAGMEEYTYAISYDNEEEEYTSPVLYRYDYQSKNFEKKYDIPQGEVIKFVLPENVGNGNIYYFKRPVGSKNVNLFRYSIKAQQEEMVCSDWLNKFTNVAPGMAIGIIENTLCGLEASIDKGFEIVSFGEDGKTTLLKKAFPYDAINGKYVRRFYCEDDNLTFIYDSESRCVLTTGKIRFEGDNEDFDCLLSLNLRTGEVKMLRDEPNDAYYYEVLATKQGIVLVETSKDEYKTTLKLINPETLEIVSALDEVNQHITFSIYNEKTNSIYWERDNGTSNDYIMEYSLENKEISVSNGSLPYIEALFSIKY